MQARRFPLLPFLAALYFAVLVAGCADPVTSPLASEDDEPASEEVLAASQDDRCLVGISDSDLRARVASLLQEVEALEDSGALNQGQARALSNHLRNVLDRLDEGLRCPAEAQLNAFREQLDELVEDGALTDREAFLVRHGWRVALGSSDAPTPGEETYAPGVTGEIRTVQIDGEDLTYEVIDGLAIFTGDMILGYADEFEEAVAGGGPAAVGVCIFHHFSCERWHDHTIGFDFHDDWGDDETNREMRERIMAAIDHWRENTGLHFEHRSSGERVVFRNSLGCSSWVGRKVFTGTDPQWINLSTGCGFGAIVHEIAHAVGIYHEQSRDDRDDFVRVNLDLVDDTLQHNFEKYRGAGRDVGPYDFGSIMHYPCGAFRRAGMTGNTVEPIVDGVTCDDLGRRDTLSDGDILGAYSLYPPETATITGASPGARHWRFDLALETQPKQVQDRFIFWSSDRVEEDPSARVPVLLPSAPCPSAGTRSRRGCSTWSTASPPRTRCRSGSSWKPPR